MPGDDGLGAAGRLTPPCAHCGEPATQPVHAAIDEGERVFCCTGCAAAASWITASGLGDYYRWRSAPGPRIGGSDGFTARDDFAAWDREDTLASWTEAESDGVTRSVRLAVGGMHCAACAWLIDKALRREPGVREISANAVDGRLRLRWAPAEARLSALLMVIARLGYRPSLPASPWHEAERRRARNRRLIGLGIAGIGTLQAMMFSEALYLDINNTMPPPTRDAFRWMTALISAPVVFIAGAPFLRGMANELRLRTLGMDTLIGSGVLLAWVGSLVETLRGGPHVWFDAAVMFVLFLLAARHLEAELRASGEARLDALAGAQPALAWREADGRLEQVLARELANGDVVRVGSGEALPCDGQLLDAEAEVDDALLTGESRPRRRSPGDTLLAGSLVHGGTLRLRATAVGSATAVSQVARRVESLRGERPPLADRAERLARRVVGITLVLTLLTALVWLSIDPSRAFPIALAVLVATCPCALALAVPAAIARAQGLLATRGVLVLSADALPRLAAVDSVVFDKTGTLTRGTPALIEAESLDGTPIAAHTAIAARLEAAVSHPLARAFGRADATAVREARQHPGLGVSGIIDERAWRLGRSGFAAGPARSTSAGVGADDDDGALWLSADGRAVARFVVDDAPRDDARDAVAALRAGGFGLTVLSGDAQPRVDALAAALDLDAGSAQGRQSPTDKLAALRALQGEGRRVLAVGDGVNDADLLAAADVSIAMAEGAALAQRQADLVLGGPRLSTVVEALRIARQARAITRQNLAWAVGYNFAILPLAAFGLIGPGLAALGMALSSLAVTANAWRIGRGTQGVPL
ncbi:MAG TPA: ATPase P [Xanthomonadaceae bacterium]|nr:ATPase P [Xanthomonadaceae bacterium]